MPLPYRPRSRAVLIGTGSYRDERLPDLPSVANNLRDLRAVLTDQETGGFDDQSCTVIENPADQRTVVRSLAEIAAGTDDVLLVYYAGHGVVGARRHELHLGMTSTELDQPAYSALPFAWVRDELVDSKAATKVLILDCCFSGLAIDDFMTDLGSLVLGQVGVSGTYILTSTSATTASLAPAGARHTAFSGELLALLRDGVPDGPAELDLRFLYRQLRQRMTDKGWPTPRQRGTDDVHDLALGRNPAHRRGPAVAPTPTRRSTWIFQPARADRPVTPTASADTLGYATDQLGSDKAAVRMSGLYTLEGIAQESPGQRQTVVNVICGYLRMRADDQRAQEHEVRRTAQQILERHLCPGRHGNSPGHPFPGTFWDKINLDLAKATLVDFSLAGCRVDTAFFTGACFVGAAELSGVHIDHARFEGAVFTEGSDFSTSRLGRCTFTGAAFGADTTFLGAKLDDPDFSDAEFGGAATFWKAHFQWGATFDRATFHGAADFGHAQFGTPQGSESEPVDTFFRKTTFKAGADFRGARLIHGVDAAGAVFPDGQRPPELGRR